MALAVLSILYIVIIIAAVGSQILLYKPNTKEENKAVYFGLNIILIFALSYIVYTSLPSNQEIRNVLPLAWSGLAVLAFMIKLNTNKAALLAKLLLTLGLTGNLIQLFF